MPYAKPERRKRVYEMRGQGIRKKKEDSEKRRKGEYEKKQK